MRTAVISITKSGDIIGEKLKSNFTLDIYSKNNIENFDIKEITRELMENYEAIIFISSTGIAVRAIAPYITTKDKDPAVVVIDNSGKFIISLLSGHLGGANELTMQMSEILKGIPVITTATDNLGIEAPDMVAKNNNLLIDDLKYAKNIAALLVDSKKVGFIDLKSKISLPKGYTEGINDIDGLVYVTHNLKDEKLTNQLNSVENYNILKLIRKDIVLGIGCRKNFDYEKMKETVDMLLGEFNIDKRAVKFIGTVEVKKNEEAIIKLSEYLDCDIKIFSIEEIRKVQHKYAGSDFVEKTIGVRAVCEPCVELLNAKLISEKINADGMTLCIGELDSF